MLLENEASPVAQLGPAKPPDPCQYAKLTVNEGLFPKKYKSPLFQLLSKPDKLVLQII